MNHKQQDFINKINESTSFYDELIKHSVVKKFNPKQPSYIIFDKLNNPLILSLQPFSKIIRDNDLILKHFKYSVFDIANTPKCNDNNFKLEPIGIMQFSFYESGSFLSYIRLYDKNYASKGVGSSLIDFFEYISFINGKNTCYGQAVATDGRIINMDDLVNFYKHKGFAVEPEYYEFTKNLNPKKQKEFAMRIVTKKTQNNVFYKILLPKSEIINKNIFSKLYQNERFEQVLSKTSINK